MKKYNGKSIASVKTQTGKLPDSFGFPSGMKGVTRKLTAEDRQQQKRNGIAPPIFARV